MLLLLLFAAAGSVTVTRAQAQSAESRVYDRYHALVEAYRAGEAQPSVDAVLQLEFRAVNRAAEQSVRLARSTLRTDSKLDPAFFQAASMLHADAALHCWRTGRDEQARSQFELASHLVDASEPEGAPPGAFRPRWYIATALVISTVGPVGTPKGIGREFFEGYAAQNSLRLERRRPSGVIPDFHSLAGPNFDSTAISPSAAGFYERTSEFELDAWSQWSGVFRPFGWALAEIFSRRLNQLNIPLSGLDTSRGMTSDVVPIVEAGSNRVLFTAWVRQLLGTGRLIYAGAYSTCDVPGHSGRCVRIVFPLPNGNTIVIMRPVALEDGSLSLISSGGQFGSPAFTSRCMVGTASYGPGIYARFANASMSMRGTETCGPITYSHCGVSHFCDCITGCARDHRRNLGSLAAPRTDRPSTAST